MATVTLKLWTYSKPPNGRFPVKLVVNHGDDRRMYAVRLNGHSKNLHLTEKEFIKTQSYRTKLGQLLKAELKRADTALPVPFSWMRFNAAYLNKGLSFFVYFENNLEKLKNDGKIGTYLTYKNALSKWKKVSDDFQPIELNDQLHKLDIACNTRSTASIYLRASRAVYNLIRKDLPDLPNWNYKIRSKVNTHKGRTLTIEQLQEFVKIKSLTPAQKEARRIFMISFYAAGMNMIDILNLKWIDIKENRIIFKREKTKNTSDATIEIPITDNLSYYLGRSRKSEYVIDYFNHKGTLIELKNRAKGFIRNINRRIKLACVANGIEPFTTYSARHTFASQLKFNGVDISQISEMLGHSSIKTTESYLRRFDIERKAEAINSINLKID